MAGLTKEQRAARAAQQKAVAKATAAPAAEAGTRPDDAHPGEQIDVQDMEPIKAKKKAEDLGLVAVIKDGEILLVHPTCLKAHMEQGWTLGVAQ